MEKDVVKYFHPPAIPAAASKQILSRVFIFIGGSSFVVVYLVKNGFMMHSNNVAIEMIVPPAITAAKIISSMNHLIDFCSCAFTLRDFLIDRQSLPEY